MAKIYKPRKGTYYGMAIVNSEFADGTWLEGEEFTYPSGGYHRRAYAQCEDGRKRVFQCSIPDTAFSIPAKGRINGVRVSGFLSNAENEGLKFTQTS
jgi:hypothetical protein